MGWRAFPLSVVIARSWKLDEWICPNFGVFSSLIKCNVAMLATNPMPGKPSIKIGSLRTGFSVKFTMQTILLWFLVMLVCVLYGDGFVAGN